MKEAVIIDAVRTPMGRSKNGVFRNIRAEVMSAHTMQTILARYPQVEPDKIDDVIWGCVKQTREQGFNIARMAALLAGIPEEVPAQTVNRLCGSSMQAIHTAAASIQAGLGDIYIVGGVEHMGHVAMGLDMDIAPQLALSVAEGAANMGWTAERLASRYNICRNMQDAFAVRSHQRAAMAEQSGYSASEIIATRGHDASGVPVWVDYDEVIRADTSKSVIGTLKPVFKQGGTVTAANASAISDGASAMLVMSASKAKSLGLVPRAKIRCMGLSGCAPSEMGIGPVPATKKALAKGRLKLRDIEVAEFNEAFAAQVLASLQALDWLDEVDDKINLHGGAISLGHPLGCSGARITGTLLNVMETRDVQLGLATMCIGYGQGIATVLERV
ncbi:acetyl-CoA C-acyltransferase FadA [Shewanella corallii]|uniref:acetyl-CoA C-acyltransferase n=1 Tax=Shewanella corallii TaxID=560080 RepID=A0ABT0NAN8_9GAMM|nr:acetyl-CoA C-acyltransferase FadA [Shewanella corallii]MCL2915522.1 acetyl-CoA C-acyltransferase FadA [Shewanella corallii]